MDQINYCLKTVFIFFIPVLIEAKSPRACNTLTTSFAMIYNHTIDIANASIISMAFIKALGGFRFLRSIKKIMHTGKPTYMHT